MKNAELVQKIKELVDHHNNGLLTDEEFLNNVLLLAVEAKSE